MKTVKKVIIALLIIIIAIVVIVFVYKIGYKAYLTNKFNSRPVVEVSAKIGENAELISENLKITIRDMNIDVENSKLSYTIDFSSVDEKGISSYILYDWLIYDADKNIIANNSMSLGNKRKKIFFLGFATTNFDSTSFKSLSDSYIGIVSATSGIDARDGTVKQDFEGHSDTSLKLPLTVRISNIEYKNQGEPEKITPDTDFVFTYNQ